MEKRDMIINVSDEAGEIYVHLSGRDLTFTATPSMLTFILDEDLVANLAFQLNSILQDRDIKKQEARANEKH